jgi:outer membrane protein OmpU
LLNNNKQRNNMNNFKKIGLSALAGSLVAFSAQAGTLTATGSASLTMADADVNGTAISGNQFTMGDSITLTGSGEMDNGMTISVSFEIDNDDTGGGDVYDSHSMTLDTNGMGTITFAGHGGSSAMSALDDVTPNAYEESWDGVTGADTGTRVNGSSGDNMFTYKSPSLGGAVITMAYLNASDAVTDVSYNDFAIAYSPEMVDGLTVGYGQGEREETTGTLLDDKAMYVKYTYGSVTVGYQENDTDGATQAEDIDFEAFGISYAISDDLTIAYSQSESTKGGDVDAQEAAGISASFTSGGMTIGGMINNVDNVAFEATDDTSGYELNIAFAF